MNAISRNSTSKASRRRERPKTQAESFSRLLLAVETVKAIDEEITCAVAEPTNTTKAHEEHIERLNKILALDEGVNADRLDHFQTVSPAELICEQAVYFFFPRTKEEIYVENKRAFSTGAEYFKGALCFTAPDFV